MSVLTYDIKVEFPRQSENIRNRLRGREVIVKVMHHTTDGKTMMYVGSHQLNEFEFDYAGQRGMLIPNTFRRLQSGLEGKL